MAGRARERERKKQRMMHLSLAIVTNYKLFKMLTKKSLIKYAVKMYIITFWTETSDNLVEKVNFLWAH